MDSKKLTSLIQKIVAKEVKNTIAPIIKSTIKEQLQPYIKRTVKSQVKNVVNEVLSEKLMTILVEQRNGSNLGNVFNENTSPNMSPKEAEEAGIRHYFQKRRENKPSANQMREQMKEKLGISDNSMLQTIYEDVGQEAPTPPVRPAAQTMAEAASFNLSPQGQQLETGEYLDSDDEGIDLSHFGY